MDQVDPMTVGFRLRSYGERESKQNKSTRPIASRKSINVTLKMVFCGCLREQETSSRSAVFIAQ